MFSLVKLNHRNLLLLFGLVIYLLHLIFTIPQELQLIFFGSGLLLTGIPHGAMDHLLYLKQHPGGNIFYKWLRFLSFYLGYALLYGILWIINSELAILFFIGISAYHFGEMDLKTVFKGTDRSEKIISTAYGIFFLINYLLFRWPETQQILSSFPGFSNNYSGLIDNLYAMKYTLLIFSALFISSTLFIFYFAKKLPLSYLIIPLIQLAILGFITFQLPIFLGFGFYFNGWHATLSITEIKTTLGWAEKSWLYALKKAWFTNLAAFIFIITMLISLQGDLNRLIAVLFISIAILTAPHIQVISKMFKNKAES
jgi:Brp/Blh family beta-carotene 15,15'-monooxygenase